MSFDEFMKDPLMDEVSGSDFEFFTIARVKLCPAFQGWALAEPKLFPYDGSKEAGLIAREKCVEYCQHEEDQFPQPGMLTIIYADDVPTHPEGAFSQDWYDFIPAYHSKDKFKQADEVGNSLPYDLVIAGLQANPQVFCAIRWARLSQEINAVKLYQGKKTKNGYPVRFFVVQEIYENKEAAYAAAGISVDNDNEDDFADFGNENTSGLSQHALDNGWTLQALQAQSQNIHNAIASAQKGEGVPDNIPMSIRSAHEFVCTNYVIEVNDLKLLETEVAF